ncbi:hypothetical protein [Aeromicrobium chenweiae]|nr:hypothetical protein [Aeromicrobium chenweiae]TGN32892.1 hypothetical protein E4L97_09415 [Aeromicrobium chenweiae]
MKTRVIKGAVLALFGALTIAFGQWFGLDLDQVALLGVALGAVIGLVPDRSLTERIIGFAIGFVLAWIGYAIRAAILPDTATGRAVVVFAVIIVAMLIAVVTASRVPLWAMLVGSAAIVGAYEQTYAASPTLFLSDSPTAATTVLLACAMGVLGSVLLGEDVEERRADEHSNHHHSKASA